jgi:type II secretory pathway pseudopilin PulG
MVMSGGTKWGAGYTIVEIMIVVAVTGVLFLVAYATISGKQNQAQFTQSVREFQSNMIDIMNDVSSGYYPTSSAAGGGVQCSLSGGPGSRVHFTNNTGGTQGANLDCTFIGKVLQFNRTQDKFNVITVVGTRVDSTGAENTDIASAHPVAGIDDTTSVNLSETQQLKGGLRVVDVITTDTNVPSPGSIGFFTSFPKYNQSAIAGALSTDMIGIRNTSITDNLSLSPASANNAVSQTNNLDSLVFGLNPTVVICLEQDGQSSNGRRAALIIGNRGRGATAELQIDNAVYAVDMIDNINNGTPACNY